MRTSIDRDCIASPVQTREYPRGFDDSDRLVQGRVLTPIWRPLGSMQHRPAGAIEEAAGGVAERVVTAETTPVVCSRTVMPAAFATVMGSPLAVRVTVVSCPSGSRMLASPRRLS